MRTGRMTARGTVGVSLDITNTGRQSGKEVVQLYVRDVVSSLMRPPQELKGFRKVALKPGETRKVEFLLDNRSFSFYDAEKKDWVLEPGEFEILIGSSSRDIRASHRINIK
jgi:beta-glucosidase